MARLLFVQSRPPHGTLYGQEGLDAILAGSAFVPCAVLFLGDGIFQLLKGQQPDPLGSRDYSVSYEALPDYGVEELYCVEADLTSRGLTLDDLIVPLRLLSDSEVSELYDSATAILDF